MNEVLEKEIHKIRISMQERRELKKLAKKISDSITYRIKKLAIDAEVFIGGSLAKDTVVRGSEYDIDLFVRFNTKYSEDEIKKLMKRIFWWFSAEGHKTKLEKVHGSRDYYKMRVASVPNILIEIIPTLKISKNSEARNTTDLSFFHVNYIKKRCSKNPQLIDEILLAKSFCHANECYGAESYISGLSGYAVELLVIYYGSFMKFLEETAKSKNTEIIDPGKHYANEQAAIKGLNPSKIKSPIILIDPTFKERNVASALSKETFEKLKKAAKKFTEKPSIESFVYRKPNPDEIKRKAHDIGGIFCAFELKTKKQAGDIAGTKLLKFSRFLSNEISKSFDVASEKFDYGGWKKAVVYFIVLNKKEIIIRGPALDYKEGVENFKKKHPVWYMEEGKINSAENPNISIKKFLRKFKKTHKRTIKQMSIKKIKNLNHSKLWGINLI